MGAEKQPDNIGTMSGDIVQDMGQSSARLSLQEHQERELALINSVLERLGMDTISFNQLDLVQYNSLLDIARGVNARVGVDLGSLEESGYRNFRIEEIKNLIGRGVR